MRNLGAVYTPPDIASFLTGWAIRNTTDKVLDLGVGGGAFVFAAHQKLVDLGRNSKLAAEQIYGTEIDHNAYEKFNSISETDFSNIKNQDFFDASFPQMDVVIGNPPYVRRRGFPAEKTEKIREKVLAIHHDIEDGDLSQLTDLYIYFLLQASQNLKEDGRLAVVVADSWLNARYGYVFKHFLQNNFLIERIISFDRPIFSNVQVKPVMLFATKRKNTQSASTAFTRVTNGLEISQLSDLFQKPEPEKKDVRTLLVSSEKLEPEEPWGIHFKISEIDTQISSNEKFVPLEKIANTRIGIQTLAKKFFALSPEYIQANNIEPDFLKPFAHSISQFDILLIDENTKPNLYVFFCDKEKKDLQGTQALTHIEKGESREVGIRGKEQTVIGYHNKKRIQKANRPHWYDIKSFFERRKYAPILLPRLIYQKYSVIWNKAGFVPGGAIIEVMPAQKLEDNDTNIQLLLAILNSTLVEVLIRGNAQLYGGGTYTISLSRLKKTPVPDITKLSEKQQDALIKAYQHFLSDGKRDDIDIAIWDFFNLRAETFYEAIEDLKTMSLVAKKVT